MNTIYLSASHTGQAGYSTTPQHAANRAESARQDILPYSSCTVVANRAESWLCVLMQPVSSAREQIETRGCESSDPPPPLTTDDRCELRLAADCGRR